MVLYFSLKLKEARKKNSPALFVFFKTEIYYEYRLVVLQNFSRFEFVCFLMIRLIQLFFPFRIQHTDVFPFSIQHTENIGSQTDRSNSFPLVIRLITVLRWCLPSFSMIKAILLFMINIHSLGCFYETVNILFFNCLSHNDCFCPPMTLVRIK